MQLFATQQIQEKHEVQEALLPEQSIPLPLDPPVLTQQQEQKAMKSDESQIYSRFFSDSIDPQSIESLIQLMFQKEGIRYYPHMFEEHLQAQIIKEGLHYEITIIQVKVGFFKFQVSVLVEEGISHCHEFACKKSRNQSAIYIDKFRKQKTAIKCFPFNQQNQIADVFGLALKEFSLLKIASAMDVGPSLPRPWGFDIIIKANCVEFAMEQCLELGFALKQLQKQNFEGLKKKLQYLHYFQMMHMDIKPANIMFSETKGSLVLIDFGFSKVVKEKTGFKSNTLFYGSVIYCNKDMLKILQSETEDKGWVDLYSNDVHCLQLSLKEIQTQRSTTESPTLIQILEQEGCYMDEQLHCNFFDYQNFEQHQLILQVKHALYYRNILLLKNPSYRKVLLKKAQMFARFLLEFPYYKFYEQVLSYITSNQASCGSDTIYKRRMQFKKEQTVSFSHHKEKIAPENNVLLAKLNGTPQSKQVSLETHEETIALKVALNLLQEETISDLEFQRIFERQSLQKLSESQLLCKVCKLLDFRHCFISLQNKLKLCNIIKQKKNQDCDIQQGSSDFPELSYCFRHIFGYFMTKSESNYYEMICNALINLVIIDGIEYKEIQNVVDRLVMIQENSVKSALMFVRLYYIEYWAKEKIKYMGNYTEIINTRHKLIKRLKCFQGLPRTVACVIQFRLSFEDKNSEWFLNQLWKKLKLIRQLEERQVDQLMSYALLYNTGINSQSWDLSFKLREYANLQMKGSEPLTIFHLKKLTSDFSNSGPKSFSPHNYSKLLRHLGSQQLLEQFKVYYTSIINRNIEEINSATYQIAAQNMRSLLSINQWQEYSRPYFAIKWYFKLMTKFITNKQFQLMELCCFPIANIITVDYLSSILDMMENHSIVNLFGLIKQLFEFLFCFVLDTSEKVQQGRVCFQRLRLISENFKLKCTGCRDGSEHVIKRIQMMLCAMENNQMECIRVGYEQINKNFERRKIIHVEWSGVYIQLIIKNINFIKQPDMRIFHCQRIYQLVRNHSLYKYFYLSLEAYKFFSKFTLIDQNNPQQYIYFHSNLWAHLAHHPDKNNIRTYINNTTQFFALFKVRSVTQVLKIGIKMLREGLEYGCILLAFLLPSPVERQLQTKTVVKICKYVDFISSEARTYVMIQMITFLFWNKQQIQNPRSKRRKMFTYASYLNLGQKNKRFIRQLSLKHLKNKQKSSKQHRNLYLKLHKFQKRLL